MWKGQVSFLFNGIMNEQSETKSLWMTSYNIFHTTLCHQPNVLNCSFSTHVFSEDLSC